MEPRTVCPLDGLRQAQRGPVSPTAGRTLSRPQLSAEGDAPGAPTWNPDPDKVPKVILHPLCLELLGYQQQRTWHKVLERRQSVCPAAQRHLELTSQDDHLYMGQTWPNSELSIKVEARDKPGTETMSWINSDPATIASDTKDPWIRFCSAVVLLGHLWLQFLDLLVTSLWMTFCSARHCTWTALQPVPYQLPEPVPDQNNT